MNTVYLFREIAIGTALIAAVAYLWMYARNPFREHTVVGRMLMHLGIVQVLVYGGGLYRLIFIGPGQSANWVEASILLTTSLGAMSLTVFVLVAYVVTQREARRMREIDGRVPDPPNDDPVNHPRSGSRRHLPKPGSRPR